MSRRLLIAGALGSLLSLLGCADQLRDEAGAPAAPQSPANAKVQEQATPSPVRRTSFEVDLPGTQPRWDPREVDELPPAPPQTVQGLPRVIDPPQASTPLADSPVGAAVLVVQRRRAAQLLSTDGQWRTVPLVGRHPRVALSPEGTRLVTVADESEGGVVVHSLGSGERHAGPYPAGFDDWDYETWLWIDEETLFLQDFGGGWVIDATTGTATEVPYPGSTLSWSFDPAGHVVASADWGAPRVLTDWAAGRPREVSMRRTGRLSSLHADADTVVGTSYDGHGFAVIVADRATLTPRFVLPLGDHEANYSNWGLSVAALRDDGTVLLCIAAIGRHDAGARLVAWDPFSADLSIVSRHHLPVRQSVIVAEGMLRRTDP